MKAYKFYFGAFAAFLLVCLFFFFFFGVAKAQAKKVEQYGIATYQKKEMKSLAKLAYKDDYKEEYKAAYRDDYKDGYKNDDEKSYKDDYVYAHGNYNV